MNPPSVVDFIQHVLPWPGPQEPGYVNLHWSAPSRTDPSKKFWMGKPTRSVEEFFELRNWLLTLPNACDVYYCTSLQSQHDFAKNGKPKAKREAANARALKAIWLDVDVKSNGYASLAEAGNAVAGFRGKVGLPPPSALIMSGGGLHVYWISDKPLEPETWQTYSNGLRALASQNGLKYDSGCTIDRARILRVPGTYNYKNNQKREVKLLHMVGLASLIQFETALSILPAVASTATSCTPAVTSAPLTQKSWLDPSKFPPRPRRPGSESLADGIRDDTPLDERAIFKGCEWLQLALMTGGKTYDQPQWHLTTLCSTFLEHGEKRAHQMASGHADYGDGSQTQAMYERKERERKERNLGWPSCTAIEQAGSASCAACPYRGKIKSPLSLGFPKPVAFVPAPSRLTATVTPWIDLPKGYTLNSDSRICKAVFAKNDEGDKVVEHVPLFGCTVGNCWMAKDEAGDQRLHYTVTLDKGNTREVIIPVAEMHGDKIFSCMLRQNAIYRAEGKRYLEGFHLSFVEKLHEQEATLATQFGWFEGSTGIEGFAYGGTLYKQDGSEKPVGITKAMFRDAYTPHGALQPWLNACKLITDMRRAPLQALVAIAFGAPLMKFTGKEGGILSVWGDPASGKSAAQLVSMAVWGHPVKTKIVITATTRSILEIVGRLRHLPVIRDDVQDGIALKTTYDLSIPISQGADGTRMMGSSLEIRERLTWQTCMTISLNRSFAEYVRERQESHLAGVARILEGRAYKIPEIGGVGVLDDRGIADRAYADLSNHYGLMGMLVAKKLATEWRSIKLRVEREQDAWNKTTTTLERYRAAIAAVTIVGAEIANELGTEFDIPLLREWLEKSIMEMRNKELESGKAAGSGMWAMGHLTDFLKEHLENIVWTDVAQRVGAPPAHKLLVKQLNRPNPHRVLPCYAHFVRDFRELRIAQRKLHEFLKHEKRNVPITAFVEAMETDAGMRKGTRHFVLAYGTPQKVNREPVYVFDIAPGSALEDMMNNYNDLESLNPGAAVGQTLDDTAVTATVN